MSSRLERYNKNILSDHVSGIASNAVSFPGVVMSLNNNQSNKTYFC